jgi:hypothetical protein
MTKLARQNKVSVHLGPNEKEILKEIESIRNRHNDATNVFNRALQASRYLLEVDEKAMLELLNYYLKQVEEKSGQEQKNHLHSAKNIAYLIYAVMISKYGVLYAEPFESLPLNLDMIEKMQSGKQIRMSTTGREFIKSPSPRDIRKVMHKMSMAVNNVFL